jgi:para-nitrobenzyl esterase
MFNKAIMSSGGGVSKMFNATKEENKYEFNKKIMEYASCKTLQEFKNVSVEVLFDAWNKAKKDVLGMPSTPVIDNKLIVDKATNILKESKQHHIPYLLGSNSEDMFPPFMHKMAFDWCKKQVTDSYCYMFNHQLPSDNNGAWHSSDLWYFFGRLDNCWRDMKEDDYKLSDVMIKYITNFAKTGNPNGDDLPLWSPINKKNNVMHLGNKEVLMKKVNKAKLVINMLSKKQVGE